MSTDSPAPDQASLVRPPRPRAGIILIVPDKVCKDPAREAETTGLVRALEVETLFVETFRLRKPHPATLISSGQWRRLGERLDGSETDLLVIDTSLTPVQQRNLEKRLKVKILDRTGLILEIFGLRARSAEGRLQVEMARLLYERSRLVRTWTHLERQRGGLSFVGGPGESQLESDRRMLDRRISRYRQRLEQVRCHRRLQGRGRTRRGLPVVALVGYTNAGKSTLFNALSGAGAMVADMPFATLDPTVRELALPSGRRCALIDTVGFISDLPTCLIAAFRATIEQVVQADLLLHVRDMAHPGSESQNSDVQAVLRQLEQESDRRLPPVIEVWNKSDALNRDRREALSEQAGPDAVPVSALSGNGQAELLSAIEGALHPARHSLQIMLSPGEGKTRAWLYRAAEVTQEDYALDGSMRLQVLATPQEIARIRSRSLRSDTALTIELT